LYWGKIIGTVAGLAIGSAMRAPWLALLGLFFGHQFDNGFAERYRSFTRDGTNIGRVSEQFVRALFSCMGHLAKTDGRVTEGEIRAARLVMHRIGLKPAQVRRAIGWFDDGKRPGFPFDTLRKEERARIWTICTELNIGRVELAQLEAMIRAQKGFKRSPAGDADAARVRGAYEALGISSDASNDDIKKAYRRLMNKNHPDKISSSNPGADVIAEAERRTREVRGAYEMLKARRSIR
jgi:DnaJ like chaperone protein